MFEDSKVLQEAAQPQQPAAAQPTATEPVQPVQEPVASTPASEQSAAPAPEQPVQQPQTYQGNKIISQSTPGAEGQKSSLILVEDPLTHKRTVKWNDIAAEPKPQAEIQEQPIAPQQPVQQPQQQVPQPFQAITQPAAEMQQQAPQNVLQNVEQKSTEQMPKYGPRELAVAIATNTVDESRVPEDLKNLYVQATIQKAQNDYNHFLKQKQQEREALEKQVQQQADNKEGQQEFIQRLNDEAIRLAYESLGTTKEQYDKDVYDHPELEDKFKAAKDWHMNKLMSDINSKARENAAIRQQRQNTYAQINAYIDQQRQIEPHFAEIDAMLPTLYQNMEYKYSARIAKALESAQKGLATDADAEVLREYYEFGRKVYYAKKNNLNPTQPTLAQQRVARPPVVEQAGNGSTLPNAGRPNPLDLRNMRSSRERADFYRRYFGLN